MDKTVVIIKIIIFTDDSKGKSTVPITGDVNNEL